jgi:hypothetical protein
MLIVLFDFLRCSRSKSRLARQEGSRGWVLSSHVEKRVRDSRAIVCVSQLVGSDACQIMDIYCFFSRGMFSPSFYGCIRVLGLSRFFNCRAQRISILSAIDHFSAEIAVCFVSLCRLRHGNLACPVAKAAINPLERWFGSNEQMQIKSYCALRMLSLLDEDFLFFRATLMPSFNCEWRKNLFLGHQHSASQVYDYH